MSRSLSTLLVLATSLLSVSAHLAHDHRAVHEHTSTSRLPTAWYQRDDHPVASLFRRADDNTPYPEVGSPEWVAKYPRYTRGKPDLNLVPKQWLDALKAAVDAGKIPNVPISSSPGDVNPTYPAGADPMSPDVCSATYKKCHHPDDLWDAPDGMFAVSFDDGPLPSSNRLLDLVEKEKLPVTHFMIGITILDNAQVFKRAFELGGDIAVHTYTHPYMTTLTNEQVVAELGWTMQIIHDSTKGRVPKYWRPPMGDSDNRVRAIAKEVFGMTTVIWNRDSEDWSIGTGPTAPTVDAVKADITSWITGPKSPGIMDLEHELSDTTVGIFLDLYPLMKSNGWKFVSVARMDGGNPYQNAASNDGPATLMDIVKPAPTGGNNTTTTKKPDPTPNPPTGPKNNNSANNTTKTPSGDEQQPGSAAGVRASLAVFSAGLFAGIAMLL